MPSRRCSLVPLVMAALAACGSPEAPVGPDLALGGGVQALANGDGAYNQPLPASLGGGSTDIALAMTTIIHRSGQASGSFRHTGVIQGLAVDFEGVVTCAAVDPVAKRAWIGGVITANGSTHPSFTEIINQVGKDIWFRVADWGPGGSGDPDRSTFVGFEGGGGIITSAQYCAARIWPNDANPLVRGNLTVR